MIADAPTTLAIATIATPTNSPSIMNIALLCPILNPKLRESVIHIPGVNETKKNVGIKTNKIEKFIASSKGNSVTKFNMISKLTCEIYKLFFKKHHDS